VTALSASKSSASELPGPTQVHLWLCPPERAEALDDSVLSETERSRHRDAALGRTWLRYLLTRYADVAPADWVFETGRHGKPQLADELVQKVPLEFNLSHSGSWLVVAVTGGVPVVVDVQQLERHRPVARLARRYFSAPETEQLERLDGEDYYRHFYRLWTLKEAWTKAHGGALPTALGEVGYRLDGSRLECLVPGAAEPPSQWLAEMEGHSLALCGLRRGLSLECLEWLGSGEIGALELQAVASCGMA
jgi:4'-phosphopantetheinyl transferase